MQSSLITFIFSFSHFMTLYLVFPLVCLVGVYLTFKLKGVQICKLGEGFATLLKKDTGNEGDITHFEAISAVLAGNLGTGNISGMAVALTLGGPGALVWMWMMALLGAVLKYAGCFLGVKYRHKNEEGEHVGGPMYYLKEGANRPFLAKFYAFFAILSAFTAGNLVQVNSVTLPLEAIGFPKMQVGLALALFTAFVMLGGMRRFASVAATLVPMMASLYLAAAIWILSGHLSEIPGAFSLIWQGAFSGISLAGGSLGYGLSQAISSGFERGIFATDAGTGMAPILQASSKTSCPKEEGMVAMVAPILVMVICTLTALVLIVTGAYPHSGFSSTNMCTHAFELGIGHKLGGYIVIFSLLMFAFTTILAWGACADRAVEFCFGLKSVRFFNWIYILIVPFGAFSSVEFVWPLADVCIAFMLITNLVGLIFLRKEVI